jgi:hypothetical protein
VQVAVNGDPVEVRVLAGYPPAFDREDIDAVADDRPPVLAGAHLILAHEVPGSDAHALALEADVRPLLHRGGKRGVASAMEMEHRVLGVHRHDRVQVVVGPGCPVTGGKLFCLGAHRSFL